MCDIIIRHSENADIPALQQLFAWPEVARETALPLFQSSEDVRQRITELRADGCSIVACLEDKIVGHLLIEPEEGILRRHSASFSLCVMPPYQGRGIGNALMRTLLVVCYDIWALERIGLMVFTDNHQAVRLYKKFGFETEGLCRRFSLRDGVLSDVYLMARLRGENNRQPE